MTQAMQLPNDGPLELRVYLDGGAWIAEVSATDIGSQGATPQEAIERALLCLKAECDEMMARLAGDHSGAAA